MANVVNVPLIMTVSLSSLIVSIIIVLNVQLMITARIKIILHVRRELVFSAHLMLIATNGDGTLVPEMMKYF